MTFVLLELIGGGAAGNTQAKNLHSRGVEALNTPHILSHHRSCLTGPAVRERDKGEKRST